MSAREELARLAAEAAAIEALVAAEKQRRREAARPKPKARWVRVEDAVMPPAPEPTRRGRWIDSTLVDDGDPDRQVWTREQVERVLYERGATIDAPDSKPPKPSVEPRNPTIRVPRRTQVQTGAGEIPPKPTRWDLGPRDGKREKP